MNFSEPHQPAHPHTTKRAIMASTALTAALMIAPMMASLLALVLTRAAGGLWPIAALNALNATLATAGFLTPLRRHNPNPGQHEPSSSSGVAASATHRVGRRRCSRPGCAPASSRPADTTSARNGFPVNPADSPVPAALRSVATPGGADR
jgi:hypothetical protein